ncbi:MAG: CPBP family intramembrane metalloprotease, partial [Salinibacterium sp.]|nr:CPBP family intramembrane metalloprotease [Salinibacterium sp.]
WLFVTLVAPVIIAPVVEEVYFRGALVRGIERVVPATRPLARLALPVAISSIVFALVHVVNVASPTELVVVGLSTLIFGTAASCAALATGRIGAPIIAHITFNGLVVVPMVLGF